MTDWSQWGSAAFAGAVQGIRQWQQSARFQGIKITGAKAFGNPGVLQGSTNVIKQQIKTAMLAKQCPTSLAGKFANGFEQAWRFWQDNVMVPGLSWYPPFAAFPGPVAPPTPNVPMKLSKLPSAGLPGLKWNQLETTINNRLGSARNHPGAGEAVNQFSKQFASRFTSWRNTLLIQNVRGQGPVPSFKPPLALVGPVVNGTVVPSPGALSSKNF